MWSTEEEAYYFHSPLLQLKALKSHYDRCIYQFESITNWGIYWGDPLMPLINGLRKEREREMQIEEGQLIADHQQTHRRPVGRQITKRR